MAAVTAAADCATAPCNALCLAGMHGAYVIQPSSWAAAGLPRHKDCVAVHDLLANSFADATAAEQWCNACQNMFQWSAHFNNSRADAPKANGVAEAFEKLDAMDDE